MKKLITVILLAVCSVLASVLLMLPNDKGITVPDKVTVFLSDEHKIVTMGYRDYIIGCLFETVPPTCGEEGLKAAACAISTNALLYLSAPERGLFCGAQLCDNSDFCPRYMTDAKAAEHFGDNYTQCREKLKRAADWGIAHALTYEEEFIHAKICRYSTGRTDSGEKTMPYLRALTIPYDDFIEDGISTKSVDPDTVSTTLYKALGVKAHSRREEWFTDDVYEPSGTLREIYFCGVKLTGEQLRNTFGLRSAAITVSYIEQRFVFTVKGWGDNLGMSINAASVMARQGCTAEEILSLFYNGTTLQKTASQ